MTPAERENPDLLNPAVVVGLLLDQETALSKSTNSSKTLNSQADDARRPLWRHEQDDETNGPQSK